MRIFGCVLTMSAWVLAGCASSSPKPDSLGAPAPEAAAEGVAGPSTAAPSPPCPRCVRLFDGASFAGWIDDSNGSWDIRDGAFHALGTATGPLYTVGDYGNFRLFFTVRQIGPGHKPNLLVWGKRPAPGEVGSRTLSAIQIQPPLGSMWDYREGRDDDPMKSGLATRLGPKPAFDPEAWSRCEILAKLATGTLRIACCPLGVDGTCQADELARFVDPTAAQVGPIGLQTHNKGQVQEYKDIWIEADPTDDDLLMVP